MSDLHGDTCADERPTSQLTQDDIAEFRAVIRSETGVELTDGEAWSRAIELVAMVRMLLGPIPEDREGSPDSGGSNDVPSALIGQEEKKNARLRS
jgi:hypothetical protein